MSTPIVIGFDVEPDGLDIPRRERRRWTGFERTMEATRRARGTLEGIIGAPVNFSWFLRMDPQIEDIYGSTTWIAEAYGAELDELRRAGDELGLHPHALRWDAARDGWLTDFSSAEWVEKCVRTPFDAYAQVFGVPCRAHRFGDRYLDNGVVRLLRELDVAVDLTLEPGRGPATRDDYTLPVPDQTLVPRRPYRPDPEDFRRSIAGGTAVDLTDGDLLMMPLTSADPDAALPFWRRIGRRVRHRGEPMNRPILLWAPWPSQLLWDIVARDVAAGELTVLPFMVRVDTLLRPEWLERFEAHLAALENHPFGRGVSFSTASAARADLAL